MSKHDLIVSKKFSQTQLQAKKLYCTQEASNCRRRVVSDMIAQSIVERTHSRTRWFTNSYSQAFNVILWLCISCRASEPKWQKHKSAQKVGFPPILERVPKSARNHTSCALLIQKVRFYAVFGARFCSLCSEAQQDIHYFLEAFLSPSPLLPVRVNLPKFASISSCFVSFFRQSSGKSNGGFSEGGGLAMVDLSSNPTSQ